MKDSFSFAKKLRSALNDHNRTARGLAEVTGFSEAQVSRWLNAKVVPSVRTRVKLAQSFGLPGNYFDEQTLQVREQGLLPDWYNYIVFYDIVKVKAGLLDFTEGNQMTIAYSNRQLMELNSQAESCFCMRAIGDSMAPAILSGDRLLVDHSKTDADSAAPFVVAIGNALHVRLVSVVRGRVRLEAVNKNYETQDLPKGDVVIIGKVLEVTRRIA